MLKRQQSIIFSNRGTYQSSNFHLFQSFCYTNFHYKNVIQLPTAAAPTIQTTAALLRRLDRTSYASGGVNFAELRLPLHAEGDVWVDLARWAAATWDAICVGLVGWVRHARVVCIESIETRLNEGFSGWGQNTFRFSEMVLWQCGRSLVGSLEHLS